MESERDAQSQRTPARARCVSQSQAIAIAADLLCCLRDRDRVLVGSRRSASHRVARDRELTSLVREWVVGVGSAAALLAAGCKNHAVVHVPQKDRL